LPTDLHFFVLIFDKALSDFDADFRFIINFLSLKAFERPVKSTVGLGIYCIFLF